jgi:hypothetical protein
VRRGRKIKVEKGFSRGGKSKLMMFSKIPSNHVTKSLVELYERSKIIMSWYFKVEICIAISMKKSAICYELSCHMSTVVHFFFAASPPSSFSR